MTAVPNAASPSPDGVPFQLERLTARINRVTNGCSHREVAERTNHNPETVRRYRNGFAPSASFIYEVARSYGVSADWLLGIAGEADDEPFVPVYRLRGATPAPWSERRPSGPEVVVRTNGSMPHLAAEQLAHDHGPRAG